MIRHRSRFRENDDLPLHRDAVVKKKPPFSNEGALILVPRGCAPFGQHQESRPLA